MENLYNLIHTNINDLPADKIKTLIIPNVDKAYLVSQIQDKNLKYQILSRHKELTLYIPLELNEILELLDRNIDHLFYLAPSHLKLLINHLNEQEYRNLVKNKKLTLFNLRTYYLFYYDCINNAKKIFKDEQKPYRFIHFLKDAGQELDLLNQKKSLLNLNTIIKYDLWDLFTEEEIAQFKQEKFATYDYDSRGYVKMRIPKNYYTIQEIHDILQSNNSTINHNFILALDTDIDFKIYLIFQYAPKIYSTIYNYLDTIKDYETYIYYKNIIKKFNKFKIEKNMRAVYAAPLEYTSIKEFLAQKF